MKTLIMKNNKRKMKNILLPALIILLMTGCRKDLCYNHDEHGTDIRADVKATWECEWERSDDFDWESTGRIAAADMTNCALKWQTAYAP